MTRGHLLHVTESKHHTPDDPSWTFAITCLDPAKCGGWQECDKEHLGGDGVSAENGPWDDVPEGAAWADEDYFTFHGVEHEWRYGHGWTVPFEGCVVAENDWTDSAWEIAREHGVGDHRVDDDWDDCSVYLALGR